MTEWFGIADENAQERLLLAWPDAPLTNPEVCGMILDTAREQVMSCAPAIPDDAYSVVDDVVVNTWEPPARFVFAQLQAAIAMWDAGRAPDGTIGEGVFTMTAAQRANITAIVRPADWKPHAL